MNSVVKKKISLIFKVEAVDLISNGRAPKIPQPEEGATYDKIWKKKEVAKVCNNSTLIWVHGCSPLFLRYV